MTRKNNKKRGGETNDPDRLFLLGHRITLEILLGLRGMIPVSDLIGAEAIVCQNISNGYIYKTPYSSADRKKTAREVLS